MKYIFLLKRTFITMIISLLVLGCTKDDFEEQEQSLEITPVIEILLQRGFNLKDIIETKDHYIVEGDIAFSKNIEDYGNSTIRTNTNQDLNTTENDFITSVYFRDNDLVNVDGTRTISVYLPDDRRFLFSTNNGGGIGISEEDNGDCLGENCPGALTNIWREPLQMAMSDWNNANSCFTFVLAAIGQEPDITILPTGLGGFFGTGESPTNGDPGSEIRVQYGNTSLNNSFAARRNLLAHELGHTIGFEHTGFGGGIELEGAPTNTSGGSVMTVQATIPAIAAQGVSSSDELAIVALCNVSNNNEVESNIDGPSEICRQIDSPLVTLTTYSLTSGSLVTEWIVNSPNDIVEIVNQNATSVTVRVMPVLQPLGNFTSLFGPTVEATIRAINSSGGVIDEKTITVVGDPLNNSNQTINGPTSLNIGETGTFNVIPLGFDHFTSVSWSIYSSFDTLFAIPSSDFQIQTQSNGFTAQITPLSTAINQNSPFAPSYIILFQLRNDCSGVKTLFKSITINP